jgi:hypothetical protein
MPVRDEAPKRPAPDRPEIRVRVFEMRRPIHERVEEKARHEKLPGAVPSPQKPGTGYREDRNRMERVEEHLPAGLEVRLAENPPHGFAADVRFVEEEREHRHVRQDGAEHDPDAPTLRRSSEDEEIERRVSRRIHRLLSRNSTGGRASATSWTRACRCRTVSRTRSCDPLLRSRCSSSADRASARARRTSRRRRRP